MNSIVTLPKLVEMLSREAGVDKATATEFLKAFIAVAADTLADGESLKVKGIGTFTPVGGKKGIDFEPEPALAAAINAPFSVFESVPLNDGITEEMLNVSPPEPEPEPTPLPEPEPSPLPEPEPTPLPEPEPEPQPAPEPEPQPAPEPEPQPAPEPEPQPAPEPEPQPAPEPEPQPAPEPSASDNQPPHPAASPQGPPATVYTPDYDDDDEPRSSGKGLWIAVALVIGLLLGFLGGYLMHDTVSKWVNGDPVPASPMESIAAEGEILISEATSDPATSSQDDTPVIATSDSLATDTPATQIETAPQKTQAETETERYEISRAGRYLSRMGKEYYGNEAYWIYIYKENKDKITNPSNIQPGLKIVIPPFEKYKTSDDPEQNLRDAKTEGNAVYRKYGII